jgi:hypothetical protein
LLAAFCVGYHAEIARGLPNIARGAYNTDLFSAQNLPFLLGDAAAAATSPLVGRITAGGIYAILAGACIAIWRRLLRSAELRAALAVLPYLERVLLVIGSAIIVGCFFAGQSIGYRGVFFLLVMPGLLALSRSSIGDVRNLSLGACIVIVLLMWGECFRLAIERGLEQANGFELLVGNVKILFWLTRELGWWWTISLMLVVVADFLRASPVVRRVVARFAQSGSRNPHSSAGN